MGAQGDQHLEEPAFLGRHFSGEPGPAPVVGSGRRADPYELLDRITHEHRRDTTLGYLVMIDMILVAAILLYAGRGAWVPAGLCLVAAVPFTIVTVRRARQRVREEMYGERRGLRLW